MAYAPALFTSDQQLLRLLLLLLPPGVRAAAPGRASQLQQGHPAGAAAGGPQGLLHRHSARVLQGGAWRGHCILHLRAAEKVAAGAVTRWPQGL